MMVQCTEYVTNACMRALLSLHSEMAVDYLQGRVTTAKKLDPHIYRE